MPKVLITAVDFATGCPVGLDMLRKNGFEVVVDTSFTAAPDAEAIIVADGILNAAAFAVLPRLKIVARMGNGPGQISGADAAKAGVAIADTPGLDARPLAESALAMLLSLAREVPRLSDITKQGRWVRTVFHELPGRTLGLMGFGPAARELAALAAAFGLVTIACDANADAAQAEAYGVRLVGYEELLKTSHYLVIADSPAGAVPLFGAAELALLQPGAFLVGVVPGVIPADAASRALAEGRLAGVGECLAAPAPNSPLAQFPQYVCIPAPAGKTVESTVRMGEAAAKAVISFFRK